MPSHPVIALYGAHADWCLFIVRSVVRRHGEPVDFNAGTSAESVYICFKRVRDMTHGPILSLTLLHPLPHAHPPTPLLSPSL